MTSNYERLKKWRKNHPEKVKEIAREYKEKYYNKNKRNDTNKRQPYTTEEINLILNKDFSDIELARMLKRSMKAIQIARYRYKNG